MTREPDPQAPSPDRPPRKSRRSWGRVVASLVVSGGLLTLILSRLDLDGLAASLGRMETAWFLACLLGFGLAIVCTGFRWRIGLRLAEADLPLAAVWRGMFGGVFLNMILFGPAGGDVAKSAAYGRWYAKPVHRLLSGAVMDRSLAAVASVLFAVLTAVLVLASAPRLAAHFAMPDLGLSTGLLVGIGVTLVAVGAGYRLRHNPFLGNMAHSLRTTFRAAVRSPRALVLGSALGLGSQVLMSLVMALALWSVTSADVPWTAILWAFPLITAVAAVPTSFGGVGVREGVSILLLARYGIPAEDLVAAGFIYLSVQLAWSVLGFLALAREERRYQAQKVA